MQSNPQRRRLWWAILASAFVHLLVAFSLVGFNMAFTPPPTAVEDDKPVELTMVDLSTPPTPPPNPGYLETDPSKETAEEPKEKTFESNANSVAASKVPATGDAPLPSQEGKERPFVQLQTQESSLPTDGARQPQPQVEIAPPAPTATPAPAQTPTPRPTATPKPTPLPEPSATTAPEQLAMLTGTPPPAIRDPEDAEATPPPEVEPSAPVVTARPLPERPAASAYRSQQEETKITGSITNRGASAANAVATPLGRYRKQVSDAIGSRWYYYVKAKSDLASLGTARVVADVDPQGRIQNLRILSNSANEAFANICLQSFQEAQIPPIPPDLVPTLPGGRMPLEFSFTYFAN